MGGPTDAAHSSERRALGPSIEGRLVIACEGLCEKAPYGQGLAGDAHSGPHYLPNAYLTTLVDTIVLNLRPGSYDTWRVRRAGVGKGRTRAGSEASAGVLKPRL